MPDIKTEQRLLAALKSAATTQLTSAEMQKQRISFVMGMIGDKSTVTREQVKNIVEKQEGKRVAA